METEKDWRKWMKIILKTPEEKKLPIDVLPNVVAWAHDDVNDGAVAARFKLDSGEYWAYKTITKTGTKVIDIRRK